MSDFSNQAPLPDKAVQLQLLIGKLLFFHGCLPFSDRSLAQTTRKITVGGRCACACVYVSKNTENQKKNKKCVWCVLWCEKIQKMQESLGNCQNTDSVLGAIWSTLDPKKVRKRPFSSTHCFYISPRFANVFLTWSPVPKAQKGTFSPEVLFQRSRPCVGKSPNQRMMMMMTLKEVRPTVVRGLALQARV